MKKGGKHIVGKLDGSISLSRNLSITVVSCLLLSSTLLFISFQSEEARAISPPWGDAMETGPGMWSNYSNGAGTEWQLGTPQNVGPSSTHSGQNAWGTNIASNYTTGALVHLESPHFDLALSQNTYLAFWHYIDTQDFWITHDWDGGIIEVSTNGGGSWVQIDDKTVPNPNPYYDAALRDTRGNPLGGQVAYCYDNLNWTRVFVDLSQYDGSTSFKFRFALGTDLFGGDSPGWYIDDVILSADVIEGIVVSPDQSAVNLAGTTQWFNITITNLQAISDIIDIFVSDNLGWPVELTQSDGFSPLVDTGGLSGIPDSGLLTSGSSYDIIAKVTIPAGTPYSTEDVIRVEGVPFFGSVASDSAYIRVSTPSPDVSVTDFLVPTFQVAGDVTGVTAYVTNLGYFPHSFDVKLEIYGPGQILFNPIERIENIAADETKDVTWMFTPTTPGHYTLTAVTLLAIDTVQENNASTKMMTVMTLAFEDDMEIGGAASQGQWTPESLGQNAWELGVPALIGPMACHSLTDCWGTNLNSDYKKGADIRLETPSIDLSKTEDAVLRFWHFYDIFGPDRCDGGFVEVSTDGGLSWTYIEPYSGYPATVEVTAPTPPGPGAGAYAGYIFEWEPAEFDLSSFSGQQIIIGFHLWTDSSDYMPGWAGWYVDDVQVLHIPIGPVLIFTEVQDSGIGGERIEVYNAGKEGDNLLNYSISKDEGITAINGVWNIPQINPGEHSVFSTTGSELDDDGDMMYLVNTSSGWIEDHTGYGQRGVVPDPISGESSARFWNGTAYEEYWTRSPITSFGLFNNVPPRDSQPEVVLNEVLFNAQMVGDEFVEIHYKGNSSVNLRWFTVVCDNAYAITSDIILDPLKNHYILLPTDYPGLFSELDASGENLYLYNSTGSYLDMGGWSSDHEIGKSMTRVPDGNGTHDGFDDWSSYQAGWRFGREPTMALINIWPDQVGYGDLGDIISYDLTILNQPVDDLISLTVNASSPWQIDFLAEDWSPITDTNSDSLLDTGLLLASSSFNLTVNVTIPSVPPVGSEMIAEVYANSSINKGRDVAFLVTRTYPHLEPMKRADPEEIYLEGTGINEVTEITLEVHGGGYIITEKRPQDTVLVIDSSGSMDTSDPDNLRLEAAKKYVDNMTIPDRGAVVDFDATASLVGGDPLGSNYPLIKQNIDSIDSNGGTFIGSGLEAANNELLANGDPSHLWVEILLTDGVESSGLYPFTSQQIQIAADANITIFTIGLGPAVNETILKEIADRTGGKYFHARNPEALQEIYDRIGLLVYDIAGRDLDVTDPDPMVRDVVKPYMRVDYNSFSSFPDVIYNSTDGTVFEWNVSQIRVDESWEASYKATCSQQGWVPVGVYPKARVTYVTWNKENATLPFPDTRIHVILPPVAPPTNLRTSVESGLDVRLDWDPPDVPTIGYYLIYRSDHPRAFDFTGPTYNTSNDANPTRTNWSDLGAAGPGAPREYYYTVRVVDSNGSVSTTSNTAGKWTKAFAQGRSAFSLPLEPFSPINISQLATDIPNTNHIKWLGSNGRWVTHITGMGQGINDNFALVGRGYEISLSSDANCTFVGLPGSMIRYHEGFGDSIQFRNGLAADVQGTNISLTWEPLAGTSSYEIYRSTKRDGLFDEALQSIYTISAVFNEFTDIGIALPEMQYYYWIIPVNSVGERGSGTYSVGIWIEGYRQGTDTLSLPLKLPTTIWIDEMCEMNDNIVGMAYVISGVWKFHAREMPPLVYDSLVEQAVGYQISTKGATQLVFIGF